MKSTGFKWELSWATFSDRDEDGHPIVQPRTDGDAGSDAIPLQHAYGGYSRPHDPEAGNDGQQGYCTLFVAKDGSTRFGFLGYDPRFIDLIPLPPKGSQMNYVAFKDAGEWKASFDFISGDDGTKQFYLPIGDSALSVTYGKDNNGEPVIELRHSDGSIISMFDGSIVLKSPSGGVYIEVNDDGIIQKGNVTNAGASSTPGGVPLVRYPEFASAMASITGLLASNVATMDAAVPGSGTTLATNLAAAIAAALTTATKGT